LDQAGLSSLARTYFLFQLDSNQHLRAKRQRPMSRSKPGRAGYFAACGAPAAIERGQTALSANRADSNATANDNLEPIIEHELRTIY